MTTTQQDLIKAGTTISLLALDLKRVTDSLEQLLISLAEECMTGDAEADALALSQLERWAGLQPRVIVRLLKNGDGLTYVDWVPSSCRISDLHRKMMLAAIVNPETISDEIPGQLDLVVELGSATPPWPSSYDTEIDEREDDTRRSQGRRRGYSS